MLKHLTIRNFALVRSLNVDLDRGLTVVTGESGAGKSILMNARALVLGKRASTDLIRPGASRAEVTAEFDLGDNADALKAMQAQALADDDAPQRCLCRRVLRQDGRSQAFVNGVPVTLQVMRRLTEGLVDIHGQDENQRLARREVQLDLLDAYSLAAAHRQGMAAAHRAWRQAQESLATLQAELAHGEERAELLGYQLQELNALNLAEGEFDALRGEFRRLSQAQSIQEAVSNAVERLSDLTDMRQVARELGALDDDHTSLANAKETLTAVLALADDAVQDLRSYLRSFDPDPAHLAQLSQRLDLVHELARKHRCPPDQLWRHAEALQRQRQGLEAKRSALQALEDEAEQHRRTFQTIAAKVSELRRAAAVQFAAEVGAQINSLGIKGGALHIHFAKADSERGLETVEFHITTNPNYPAGSLANIASGGERARISLAICVVAARKAQLPCLVLDEADVGVGGTTADTIGRLLRILSQSTQVLCVTHAPQVAALGNSHLVVEKDAAQDPHLRTVTKNARTEELARMLAGADVTEQSRAYARTLLDAGDGTHCNDPLPTD